jgi:hypothetical protein
MDAGGRWLMSKKREWEGLYRLWERGERIREAVFFCLVVIGIGVLVGWMLAGGGG